MSMKSRGVSEGGRSLPLSLIALGVVFGDIGTSPLYAFKEFVTERVPYWADGKPKLEITAMNDRFFRVIAHFGFMEIPTIEKNCRGCGRSKFRFTSQPDHFLSGPGNADPVEGEGAFATAPDGVRLMSRNAENAADFFQLPSDRTVEIGFPVEL
jgi:KUP system potassium uptake protein